MAAAGKLLILLAAQGALLFLIIPDLVKDRAFLSLGFLAVLLVFFFLLNRKKFAANAFLWPSRRQLAAVFFVLAALVVLLMPLFVFQPVWLSGLIRELLAGHDNFWQIILTSVKISLLFLPSVLIFFLLFSEAFIKKFLPALFSVYFFLFLQIWFSSLLAFFYNAFSRQILFLSFYILSLVPGQIASRDAGGMKLINGDVSAAIAPSCVGLGSLTLFVIFFGYLWFNLKSREGFSVKRALIALLAGLAAVFFLNILRIVFIMIVGSHLPIALKTFHDITGAVFFFAVFLVYLQFVFPRWIIKNNA